MIPVPSTAKVPRMFTRITHRTVAKVFPLLVVRIRSAMKRSKAGARLIASANRGTLPIRDYAMGHRP